MNFSRRKKNDRIEHGKCGHTEGMKTYESKLLWKKILKLAGITTGVYVGVRFFLPLVIPFFVAFALAALLHGAAAKIEKKAGKGKRALRLFLFFFFFLLTVFGGLLLIYGLAVQVKRLCLNYGNLCAVGRDCWRDCCARLEVLSGIEAEQINAVICEKAVTFWKKGQDQVMACVFDRSVSSIRWMLHAGWIMLVISVATLLIFLDYDGLVRRFQNSGIGNVAGHIAGRLKTAGGSYLKAQLIIWLCVSAICVTGLFLTGNSYALLAGIVIGVCDALPFLETGTVFIPWMILEVLQGKYGLALWYLGIYLACSITREMLEPKLVGGGIGVHPVCVLMSIYIGIKVYGGVGVIFGPLSAFLIWEIYKMTTEEADASA